MYLLKMIFNHARFEQLQSSDIGENIMRESIKLSWGGGGG